jgi:hypothetical protein
MLTFKFCNIFTLASLPSAVCLSVRRTFGRTADGMPRPRPSVQMFRRTGVDAVQETAVMLGVRVTFPLPYEKIS